MPFKPFKFLHAANLYLNHQLAGTGFLEEASQKIVQQATNSAFHNLIEEAVTWEVDFVLLTGNCFDETDQSLGSRIELLNGLAILHEANIPTFVLPGENDPYEAWNGIAGLPNSVTIIDPQSRNFFSVKQNDELIAQIGTLHSFQNQQPLPGFQIAMTASDDMDKALAQQNDFIAIEYLAMGGQVRQTSVVSTCTLHSPGGTQGVSVTDVGLHGCSLVEANAAIETDVKFDKGQNAQTKIAFIPTATVRWESPSVQTGKYANIEILSNQMSQALADIKPQPNEKLWLLHWDFYNSGSLATLIQQEKTDALLTRALHNNLSIPNNILIESTYQLLPDEKTIDHLSQQSLLAESFFQSIDDIKEELPQQLGELFANANLQQNNRTEQLAATLEDINPSRVLGQAQQMGLNWFSSMISDDNE